LFFSLFWRYNILKYSTKGRFPNSYCQNERHKSLLNHNKSKGRFINSTTFFTDLPSSAKVPSTSYEAHARTYLQLDVPPEEHRCSSPRFRFAFETFLERGQRIWCHTFKRDKWKHSFAGQRGSIAAQTIPSKALHM